MLSRILSMTYLSLENKFFYWIGQRFSEIIFYVSPPSRSLVVTDNLNLSGYRLFLILTSYRLEVGTGWKLEPTLLSKLSVRVTSLVVLQLR